ncbi:double-strand-break repair protein rad21 homolog isoform X2 [Argonauta hians]
MFYAHFVLSKKGPLAKIWLAAHWDKKLTKAHVFETNIDSSVEAILKPKVKMALRTSGHLLLGVVRIYSRKAKYLLADCNEAFVKIKMAFRPGVVDLPEENREASVAAITLQENFHDFDTTLADLNEINVQAQFSVNQSRPEEITMREDYGNITLIGDDGFGDVGFDDREILRDATNLEESLFKSPDITSPRAPEEIKNIDEPEKSLDVDMTAPVTNELDEPSFMDAPVDDDDDDDDDNGNNDDFGGEIGQEFLDDTFMEPGGLFEDAPVTDVGMEPEEPVTDTQKPQEPEAAPQPAEAKEAPATEPETPAPETTTTEVNETTGTSGEQTTLVHNEDEAFALEPLDVSNIPGQERKGKRKRKLIVDEQKGIPSETMKMQLADTSDIITTLDLAPPTKKLMHWKETGGVEKLFALPGRPIISKFTWRLFGRNLITKPMNTEEEEEHEGEKIELESPELARDDDHLVQTHQNLHLPFPAGTPQMQQQQTPSHQNAQLNHQMTPQQLQANLPASKRAKTEAAAPAQATPAPHPVDSDVFPSSDVLFPSENLKQPAEENTTVAEEPSAVSTEPSIQSTSPSKTFDKNLSEQTEQPSQQGDDPSNATDLFSGTFNDTMVDIPGDNDSVYPKDLDDEPPSIAPLSVPPPSCDPASVAPASVPPPSCQLTFEDIESGEIEGVIDSNLDDAEQEKQWNKRSLQMQHSLDIAFRYNERLGFKDLIRKHNRKQAASRFYTLLVLKKHQSVEVDQNEPFGDIFITKGPRFGLVV